MANDFIYVTLILHVKGFFWMVHCYFPVKLIQYIFSIRLQLYALLHIKCIKIYFIFYQPLLISHTTGIILTTIKNMYMQKQFIL